MYPFIVMTSVAVYAGYWLFEMVSSETVGRVEAEAASN